MTCICLSPVKEQCANFVTDILLELPVEHRSLKVMQISFEPKQNKKDILPLELAECRLNLHLIKRHAVPWFLRYTIFTLSLGKEMDQNHVKLGCGNDIPQ